jgi:DegV family protein with EDD domain
MDATYIIFSDIAADVPAAYAQENDIRFIPMHYTLGEEDRVCTGIEPEMILKRFYDGQRGGDLTQTTQISPQKYIDVFEPIMREGGSILYLSLSSGLSSTYNSSQIAAMELSEKYPEAELVCVDSRAATIGMGMLLEKAVENRVAGMRLRENAAWLEENRLRVHHWFVVEDLMYLKRGGRISPTTAIVGSALNIKPILKILPDGTLDTFAKKRGTKAALNYLAEFYKTYGTGTDGDRILVVHADNETGAEYLTAALREINPGCVVTKMMLTPIIGAHVGPGMCAFVHMGKPGVDRT